MSSLPDKGEKLRKHVDDIERAVTKLNKRIADLKPRSKVKGNCFIVILKKYLETLKMFCFKDDLIYFDNFEILKSICALLRIYPLCALLRIYPLCALLRIYPLLLLLISRVHAMKKYELHVHVFILNCICFIPEPVSILPKPTAQSVQPQVIKVPSADGSGQAQTIRVVPGQQTQGQQPQVIKVYAAGADGQQKLVHIVQPGPSNTCKSQCDFIYFKDFYS